MMAEALQDLGVIKVLSASTFGGLHGLPWLAALGVLVLVYLYIHYAFASMTAHVTALYPGFLTAAVATGAPALMAALPLAFFSNLNAGITHYGTGSAPVYFGSGYVSQGVWWRLGFIISVINIVVWLGIGPLWWKLIGLY
jgi:DASS family divalent anion:Na+ symporter